MSAYVRVRKLDELRRLIDAAGTQTDVAAAAGLSLQRLNQLYVGTHSRLEVRKARRLEDVLHVPYGSVFAAVDGPLLEPYMTDDHDEPTPDDGTEVTDAADDDDGAADAPASMSAA
jgi:hypothetical protein